MTEYGPSPRVSSIIDDWAPYYIERTKSCNGRHLEKVRLFWHGISTGMVGIGEITDAVPEKVRAEAIALQESIVSGAYHAFTGPLNKQDGSAWLASGETADDGTLAGMKFYVEGIKGKVPN